MNLHGLAAPLIGVVNPFMPAVMKISTGYATADDGSRTSTYETVTGLAQVQAATFLDLKQIEGLNQNGSKNSIYFRGAFNGVLRPAKKGGDLVTIATGPNAGVWLIVQVLEQWPDWCKVAVVLQMDTPQ